MLRSEVHMLLQEAESSLMNEQAFGTNRKVCHGIAAVAAIASVVALFLSFWGGGIIIAFEALLSGLGLVAARAGDPLPYPLGMWVYPLYLVGLVISIFAFRHPRGMGFAMVALGACMLFFGGPIARVYGVLMVVCGVLLIWFRASARPDRAGGIAG